MLLRLFLLFTMLPIVELMLLVELHDLTNLPVTLGVVLLTGVVGAWLARWQGWRTVERVREDMAAGRVPAESLLDGILIFVAGGLLIAPGLLTDMAGFLLLIPPVRGFARRRLMNRYQQRFTVHSFHTATPYDRDVIIDARVVGPTHSEPIPDQRSSN